MTEERCRQLMEQVGLPNSRSLYSALYQLANEKDQSTLAAIETARREEQEKILIGVQQLPTHDVDTKWNGVYLESTTTVRLLDVIQLIAPIQPTPNRRRDMIEFENGTHGEIKPLDDAIADLKRELAKDNARRLKLITGTESDLKAEKAKSEVIRSPEAEAYWRGVIAGELEAEVIVGYEWDDYRSQYFERAADFVRGKTQEG